MFSGCVLARIEDLSKVPEVVDGRFDAQNVGAFVVHFHGVSVGPALDANAFGQATRAR